MGNRNTATAVWDEALGTCASARRCLLSCDVADAGRPWAPDGEDVCAGGAGGARLGVL